MNVQGDPRSVERDHLRDQYTQIVAQLEGISGQQSAARNNHQNQQFNAQQQLGQVKSTAKPRSRTSSGSMPICNASRPVRKPKRPP